MSGANVAHVEGKTMTTDAETKPAYTSLTVVSAVLLIAITIAKQFGYDLSGLLQVQDEIILLVGLVGVLYGRYRASKKLSLL